MRALPVELFAQPSNLVGFFRVFASSSVLACFGLISGNRAHLILITNDYVKQIL